MEINIGWGRTITGRVKYREAFLGSKPAVATHYGITRNKPILLYYSSSQKKKKPKPNRKTKIFLSVGGVRGAEMEIILLFFSFLMVGVNEWHLYHVLVCEHWLFQLVFSCHITEKYL